MKPLASVMKWYLVTRDSQVAVNELLEMVPEQFPSNLVFAAISPQDAKATLKEARQELDDLTIVSLVAVFEQILLDYIKTASESQKQEAKNPFVKGVLEYGLKKPEYWPFKDILDIFKSIVDPNIVGNVKQIYRYRNWVAHGKKGVKPTPIDPLTAEQRLAEFLGRILA